MATMTNSTIEMIGEQLRKANQGIADLKTHIMGMEDRIIGLEGRFDGVDKRFDGIDERLDGLSNDVAWIKSFLEGTAQEMSGD